MPVDEHQDDEDLAVVEHGTNAMYLAGCRCRACRWAHLDELGAIPRLGDAL